ncbi:MAG: ATP-binding cassette domain-containing protein [Clostridia bacterium]|nr:ATP-binding cassette domain-containing protein [Clostridia bacterium]
MNGIIIDKISKSFGGKTVFKDFSAVIPLGKTTVIKGASGCGKTTLLRMISGLDVPDSGVIKNVPEKISFVFQEDRLCEDFTAAGNIKFVTGKTLDKKTVISHLSELGLENDLSKPVKELSGGMKRRVAIARAVCFDADLIILDEPFKGLDKVLLRDVVGYLKKHTQGKTVIYVTHSDEESGLMGGDCLVLSAFAKEE